MSDALAYRPASGSEGNWFFGRWCDRCTRNNDCRIPSLTMLYDVTDPVYPTEWRTDEQSGPRCTAFTASDPLDQPFDPAAAVGLLL